MSQQAQSIQGHYKGEVEDYTFQYSPDYDKYPANKKRLNILVNRMKALKVKTLLDAGCGEASPIARLAREGIDVWGFDFVESMIEKARTVLAPQELSERVWQGDILDPATFDCKEAQSLDRYDACLAMGVLPHITPADELRAIKNLADKTNPGGHVFVEFRNELFSLFTVNRYTYQFIAENLMALSEHKGKYPKLEGLLEELQASFRMDLPPVRTGTQVNPGYDEILSRFQNPHTVGELFKKAGLQQTNIHFYHYHALPPMFESRYPEIFRELSLAMEENPNDWRGWYMASAYVVEAVKAED